MIHIMPGIKPAIYKALNQSGITRVFSYFNRDKLSILCFHSISTSDEHEFWPGVFINEAQLKNILSYLKSSHYQVISLDMAKDHLSGGKQYRNPVVITIDDGWYKSVEKMIPIFQAYNFPVTLYVTSYYVSHQIPVVNVFLQYLLWKSKKQCIHFSYNNERMTFSGEVNTIVKDVDMFLSQKTDDEKLEILYLIAHAQNVDENIITDRIFHNASYQDLKQVDKSPLVDIQLHTHRHNLPIDHPLIREEIEKNRALLAGYLGKEAQMNDFCYPSGVWRPSQIPALQSLGIQSATTLDEGMNAVGGNPLKLNRNLVMQNRTLDQLRVTLSGLKELVSRDVSGVFNHE